MEEQVQWCMKLVFIEYTMCGVKKRDNENLKSDLRVDVFVKPLFFLIMNVVNSTYLLTKVTLFR